MARQSAWSENSVKWSDVDQTASKDYRDLALSALRTAPDYRDRQMLSGLVVYLRALHFFQQLPKDVNYHLARSASARDVDEADVIVRQGDEGYSLYVLLEGLATVHSEDLEKRLSAHGFHTGDEVERSYGPKVADITEGTSFGELALRGGGYRTSTVVARGKCVLMELSKEVYDGVLRQLGVGPFMAFPEQARQIASMPPEKRRPSEKQKLAEALRAVSLFEHLSLEAAVQATDGCTLVKLPRRARPLLQGHQPPVANHSFHVIVGGSISVHVLEHGSLDEIPETQFVQGVPVCPNDQDLVKEYGPCTTVEGAGGSFGGTTNLLAEFRGGRPIYGEATIITRETTECLAFSLRAWAVVSSRANDMLLRRPDKVLRILAKPTNERSAKDNEDCAAHVSFLKLFRNLPQQKRLTVCAEGQAMRFEKGEVAIRQWTMGTGFFIVLHGLFSVHMDLPQSESSCKSIYHGPLVSLLGAGDTFGERGLQGRTHSATVVAVSQGGTVALHVPFKLLQDCIYPGQMEMHEEKLSALKALLPLADLERSKVDRCAEAFSLEAHLQGVQLCRRGEHGSRVHLIQSGQVAAEGPRGNASSTPRQIAILEAGVLVGYEPWLFGEPHPVAITTSTPCSSYTAHVEKLEKALPSGTVDSLREYLRDHFLYLSGRSEAPFPKPSRNSSYPSAQPGEAPRASIRSYVEQSFPSTPRSLTSSAPGSPRARASGLQSHRWSSIPASAHGEFDPLSSPSAQPTPSRRKRSAGVAGRGEAAPKYRNSSSRRLGSRGPGGSPEESGLRDVFLKNVADEATRGYARNLVHTLKCLRSDHKKGVSFTWGNAKQDS